MILISFISIISAGIGIRSYQESALINEGEEACLTYGAYNPFATDTQVIIGLSASLNEVLIEQNVESKLIPAGTSSANAIPLEFCFKAPKVYTKDCSIFGTFLCAQDCSEPQKVYEGDVELRSVPIDSAMGGTGGSATVMSVSSPLRIRIQCTPHTRDYTLVYALLALISGLIVAIVLVKKYRKPKVERDREKLRKLKAQIAREYGNKKPKKK